MKFDTKNKRDRQTLSNLITKFKISTYGLSFKRSVTSVLPKLSIIYKPGSEVQHYLYSHSNIL